MSDKTLSVDDVLNAKDVRYDLVDVPEWGGKIRIASLSAGDVIEWLELNNDGVRGRAAGIHLILKAWVDDAGKHIGNVAHVEALRKKDAQASGRVVNAIMAMNGLSPKKPGEERKNDLSEAVTASSPTISLVK